MCTTVPMDPVQARKDEGDMEMSTTAFLALIIGVLVLVAIAGIALNGVFEDFVRNLVHSLTPR